MLLQRQASTSMLPLLQQTAAPLSPPAHQMTTSPKTIVTRRRQIVVGAGRDPVTKSLEVDLLAPSAAQSQQQQVPGELAAGLQEVLLPVTASSGAGHVLAIVLLLAGFTAVSLDVFLPNSMHMLQGIDAHIHDWVVGNTSANNSVLAKAMSNIPILAALVAWIMASIIALVKDPEPSGALKKVCIAWAAFFLLAGTIPHGDPMLVDYLKHAFARGRPSTIHSTFSYPSGHTTSAFFCIGTLLLVLLPAAMIRPPWAAGSGSSQVSPSVAPRSQVLAAWVTLGCTVAAGRVLVDAHWLSDTMAGACLGSAVALTVALLCRDSGKKAQ